MIGQRRAVALRGAMADMGAGIAMGAAFATVATGFAQDIVKPAMACSPAGSTSRPEPLGAGVRGAAGRRRSDAERRFLDALASFRIAARAPFFPAKGVNAPTTRMVAEDAAAPAAAPSAEATLLRESRDLMAAQQRQG